MPKGKKEIVGTGTYRLLRNITFFEENVMLGENQVVLPGDLYGKFESLLAAGLIEEVKTFAIEADEEQKETE
jgi:hypothetical protein